LVRLAIGCWGCDGDAAAIESAGTAIAALPCLGHGSLSLAGITAGNVVVVVEVDVVVVPGNVVVVDVVVVDVVVVDVVVVDVGVVVVVDVLVVVVVVDDRAISGVTMTSVATNTPLRPTEITVPRRSNQRGDNFTHLPYFVECVVLVTR
jgi:hypothetical protein